jgi:hypothetical protein
MIKSDLAQVSQTLKWARDDMIEECGSGEGGRCKGKRSTLAALEDRQTKLQGQLVVAPAEKATMSGETRVAWALSEAGFPATEAGVRIVWPMLPPIAFELLCAFFMCLGLGRGEIAKATEHMVPDSLQTSFPAHFQHSLPEQALFSADVPEPPVKKKRTRQQARRDKTVSWVREYTLKEGHPPAFQVVKGRFHLKPATASRWRSEGLKQAKV